MKKFYFISGVKIIDEIRFYNPIMEIIINIYFSRLEEYGWDKAMCMKNSQYGLPTPSVLVHIGFEIWRAGRTNPFFVGKKMHNASVCDLLGLQGQPIFFTSIFFIENFKLNYNSKILKQIVTGQYYIE